MENFSTELRNLYESLDVFNPEHHTEIIKELAKCQLLDHANLGHFHFALRDMARKAADMNAAATVTPFMFPLEYYQAIVQSGLKCVPMLVQMKESATPALPKEIVDRINDSVTRVMVRCYNRIRDF